MQVRPAALGVAAIAVTLAAAFSALSRRSAQSHLVKAAALAQATAMAAAAVLCVFMAAVYLVLGCDESCDSSSGQWWESSGAWQWSAQFALAAVTLAGLVAAAVQTARGRQVPATIAMGGSVVCFAAWTILIAPALSG